MASVKTFDSFSTIRQEFSASWKLKGLEVLGSESIEIPITPLRDSKMSFYFEIYYVKSGTAPNVETLIKINFTKLSEFQILPEAIMDIHIIVQYSDKSTLKEYKENRILLSKMGCITIMNETMKHSDIDENLKTSTPTNHGTKAIGIMILNCTLQFYDPFTSDLDNPINLKFHDNMKNFVNEFYLIEPPNVLTDIKFRVENEIIPAHKVVLAAHSTDFQKTFCEKDSNSDVIDVTNYSAESFRCFLKFFYTREVETRSLQTALDLVALAEKYGVSTLKDSVCDEVATYLTVDSVTEIFKASLDHKNRTLRQESLKFVLQNLEEVRSRNDFRELVSKKEYAVVNFWIKKYLKFFYEE